MPTRKTRLIRRPFTTTLAYDSYTGFLSSITDSNRNVTIFTPCNRTAVSASIPSVTSLNGYVSYSYDSKNQLTAESSTRGSGISTSFGYDYAGNPMTFQSSSCSYNSNNQLSETGYSYDGNGNPTTYDGNSMTFDPQNKLTAAGSAITSGYRIDGLRAWKEDSSTSAVTYYLYDGTVPIIELSALGVVVATNTFGINGLISRNVSGVGSTFYTFDERGNVAQRLNGSGSATSSDLYSAFGTFLTGGGDPFGFGAQFGYYTDAEIGLILCTYRYYDPSTGRWLNRDPIAYAGGINLYSYCTNNPINWSDPSGLIAGADDACEWGGLGLLVGGVIIVNGLLYLLNPNAGIRMAGDVDQLQWNMQMDLQNRWGNLVHQYGHGVRNGPIGGRQTFKSRKDAFEKAKREGHGAPPVLDKTGLKNGEWPHYHPGDINNPGKRKPGTHDHYYFPPGQL